MCLCSWHCCAAAGPGAFGGWRPFPGLASVAARASRIPWWGAAGSGGAAPHVDGAGGPDAGPQWGSIQSGPIWGGMPPFVTEADLQATWRRNQEDRAAMWMWRPAPSQQPVPAPRAQTSDSGPQPVAPMDVSPVSYKHGTFCPSDG